MNIQKVTFRLTCVVVALAVITFCSGCSMLAGLATDAVAGSVAKNEPLLGVDTEIVAGDKTQGIGGVGPRASFEEIDLEDNAQLHTTTQGKVTEVDGAESVILNEGVEFWQAALAVLLALVIGLFAPQFVITRKEKTNV